LTCGSFSFAAHEEEKDNIDRLGSPSALETDRRVFCVFTAFCRQNPQKPAILRPWAISIRNSTNFSENSLLWEKGCIWPARLWWWGMSGSATTPACGTTRYLRGDINYIRVGAHTNIQDGAVVHLADEYPCEIGDWVTVGHSAVVHACEIGNECLIGMNCTILDGAVIGAQSIVGANALITGGTQIPPGSLVLGSPAKVVRPLTEAERADLKPWAQKYVDNAAYCLNHNLNVGAPLCTRGE
jgi:carbonic anhydrase/acetyltransferase-like protein (isoleucine patch superfamily)